MKRAGLDEQLAQVTILGDPTRRALYHFVAARGTPVGRDEAAAAADDGQRVGERRAALLEALRRQGYEPYPDDEGEDRAGGAIRLRNCPFDKLVTEHRELMCRANLALLRAVVER